MLSDPFRPGGELSSCCRGCPVSGCPHPSGSPAPCPPLWATPLLKALQLAICARQHLNTVLFLWTLERQQVTASRTYWSFFQRQAVVHFSRTFQPNRELLPTQVKWVRLGMNIFIIFPNSITFMVTFPFQDSFIFINYKNASRIHLLDVLMQFPLTLWEMKLQVFEPPSNPGINCVPRGGGLSTKTSILQNCTLCAETQSQAAGYVITLSWLIMDAFGWFWTIQLSLWGNPKEISKKRAIWLSLFKGVSKQWM